MKQKWLSREAVSTIQTGFGITRVLLQPSPAAFVDHNKATMKRR